MFISAPTVSSDPTTLTTVTAGTDQSSLVYCNLNDLDFNSPGDSYASLTPLSNLAAAPPSYTGAGDGGVAAVSREGVSLGGLVREAGVSSAGTVQMVQALPSLQMTPTENKSPFNSVSTILLQGGILQVTMTF